MRRRAARLNDASSYSSSEQTWPMIQFFDMANHQPLAYEIPEFLESGTARPVRLLSEYLEPLRRFQKQNIQDTVVFFGSARVHSRVTAERALKRLTSRREHAKGYP